ncbi:uncharacterized protein LOC133423314 [Cololabis saira]|uniref:uncharacterized protein LOC133423314 n=1 Tax=Cololabis saira TaxID=129043 RepID=UPI002AD3B9BB|nr:uncharacterized protein LOC133423314 [Cololabis saira]
MMNEAEPRRTLPDQSSGSGHTFEGPRHASVINPIVSKRVCFYKSGDSQFSGLRMVVNNRTFKTFDALLDSLSKKVPLPFGVRNITTPRGVHGIRTLDELEDGKSYICSDSRKVTPINMALARRKMPPWYHVRPVSARRHNVQQARFFPGRRLQGYQSMALRTPKRLVVFRNGEPTVKHSVVLHKKTTPSYASILQYISELMQVHVVKLHTPDGRHIDGLPGLILCSGTVVAVGREAFRPALYVAQESPAPTKQHANRTGFRRLKPSNRKKKLSPFSLRNFSASSERYIVHQIHNTIAESSCDLGSNSEKSVALGSNRVLESVAETAGDGADGQDCSLPGEDNIEKSFRVNQDGSMTVEMKVRLTIKEEETVQWTTTLTRSGVADQLNVTSLPAPEAEQEICSAQSDSASLQSPAASINTIDKDKTNDRDDDDPPSMGSGVFSNGMSEEDDDKIHTAIAPPRRPPTPGVKKVRKQQTSMESIKSITPDGVQEEMVGSYSYTEETERGTITQRYCMVKENSTRPVPKPRRINSVDANSKNVSASQTLHQSSEEEITETVLHIYEQQTCQDNFLANVCSRGMSASAGAFSRPATSDSGQLSSNNEFEPELWRPSTASESMSMWRTENMSLTPDSHLTSLKMNAVQRAKTQRFQRITKGRDKTRQKEVRKDVRTSSKPTMTNKHVRQAAIERKSPKEANEARKKVKTFSSAGFIKRIYGNKLKTAKGIKKIKKRPKQTTDSDLETKSSPLSDATMTTITKDSNIPLKEKKSARVSFETSRMDVSPIEVSHSQEVVAQQAPVHVEKTNEKGSQDITGSITLPAFNSSSSTTKQYVESWLEKANLSPSSSPEEKNRILEEVAQTESGRCGEPEQKHDHISKAQELKCSEKTEPSPNNLDATSVKLRAQAFENKSSPSLEKVTVTQQRAHNHTTTADTNMTNTQESKPLSNEIPSDAIPPETDASTEMASDSDVENPVKIWQSENVTLTNAPSMEALPPPPPELLSAETCSSDVLSAPSSPLYRVSSMSSHRSDNHTSSVSPAADKATSPTRNTMEKTPTQMDTTSTQQGSELSRTPSIKRAPLVSNLSLERKMSLRKARMDKYTSDNDANAETTTLSPSTNTVGDEASPHDICSSGTQQPLQTPPEETQESDPACTASVGSSLLSTSLTSDEMVSSTSVSSSEASIPCNLSFKEPEMPKKDAPSPKTAGKREKLKSSPSPERKFQNKKSPAELQNKSPKAPRAQSLSVDKNVLTNTAVQKHVTPNASPSTERKHHQSKVKPRSSPYSQSLDVTPPPVRHKSSRKEPLSSNLSLDSRSETISSAQKKTPTEIKHEETSRSGNPAAEPAKTLICDAETPVETDQNDKNKALTAAGQLVADMQVIKHSTSLNAENQLNMKPVLEEICYSIKAIRQITRSKRPSCLEKSNSLPDFSSHVASTFGSSSKALLAFLSVMTLKDGLLNLTVDELNANNVSCAEALKMIDSLREIASIEDSHKLKSSLLDLQQSASEQLLKSWKGFQELGDRCTSRSSTPNASEPSADAEENVIDEIMENLHLPETLKEELASLSETAKSESDNERKITDEGPENSNHFATEDAAFQEDQTNTDARPIANKFTDISKPNQSGKVSLDQNTEAAKHKPNGQKAKDNSLKTNPKTPNPTVELTPKLIPEERQLYNIQSFDLQSFRHEVKEKQQLSNKDELQNLEKEQNIEDRQLRMQSGESLPEREFSTYSSEKGQAVSRANTAVSQTDTRHTSEAGEQHRLEDKKLNVAHDDIRRESSKGEDLSHHENPSEEDVNIRGKQRVSKPNGENKHLSEKKKPKDECQVLERYHQSQTCNMGANSSTDESTETSDGDEATSEEEDSVADCKKLQVIVEESLSDNEQDQEEEFIHLPNHADQGTKNRGLAVLIEETEDDQGSSADERLKSKSPLSQKEKSSWIISDDLGKDCGFNADDDSGNDHSSCDEHVDEDQNKAEDEQISSSVDEELSFYEKDSTSEEEQANKCRYTEENQRRHQEAPALAIPPDDEEVVEKLKHHPQEKITQSVAERVTLLEKQAAEAQKTKNTSTSSSIGLFSQRKTPLESDEEDSPTGTPMSALTSCTRSAPQSSLSFSYDSSGVITTEPEGSRVRSIREMFLAKSATETQQRRVSSSNSSEVRAETSGSGGYQSQTSSEQSNGEDDSARKSITKGLVRRTIERLYGKKDTNAEEPSDRPPSEPNQGKQEQPSIFSPFHVARSKALSELSYFSSTNALDALTEAARCIAFNVQVGPGDGVSLDNGQWLIRENTVIRKSVSDPVGINKSCTSTPLDEGLGKDTEGNTPYSLFSTKPEPDDKADARKCTYFSMPHTSDSEVCQDDCQDGDSVTEADDPKTWSEKNGMFPGVTDLKMMDNKVHPLVEQPPDGEVVLVQPRKGHGIVNKRRPEPDALDLLYNFCGEHCPIL